MIITGEKTIELTNQDSMSFLIRDARVDNLTGVAEVGFSGENKSILFKFISGKVYDFEDRYIDSYQANEPLSITGKFDTTNYNYNYDGKLSCNTGQKNNFKVGYFYAKATNCALNIDAKILSDPVDLKIDFGQRFTLGDSITGTFMNNSSNADVIINTGEIQAKSADYYQLTSYPSSLDASTADDIVVQNIGGTEGGLPLGLYFSTNVGDIYHTEPLVGNPEINFSVSAFLTEVGESQSNLISSEEQESITGKFSYILDIVSGDYNLEGDVSISLEYYDGKIGTYQSIQGISLTSSGNGYSGEYATLKFEEGLGKDVTASGYVKVTNGFIDTSVVDITNGGIYFETTPTVSIEGTLTGSNPYLATGLSLTDMYEKTFTGCWDLETGVIQDAFYDYRTNGLTAPYGEVFYPHGNLGPGKYYNSQADKSPINEDIEINVTNRKMKDKDLMLVKLKVSGGHPDLSKHLTNEIIITGGTE